MRSQMNTRSEQTYQRFKEEVISDILLRGVYTDSLIIDCFERAIDRHSELDPVLMKAVMETTLSELGVENEEKQVSKTVDRPFTAKRRVTLAKSTEAVRKTEQIY
jgi:hypothetical protein